MEEQPCPACLHSSPSSSCLPFPQSCASICASVPSPNPSVVKTRMQTIEAKKQYRNALHCAYRIVTEEGVLKLWKGTVPRLGRLVLSGGIVFSVYEQIYPVAAKLV